MNSLPSIYECNLWILEECQTILNFIEKGNFDIGDLVQATFENAKLLINALEISKTDKSRLLNRLEKYSKFKQNNQTMKLLILNIKEICCQFTQKDPSHYLSVTSSNFYRESITTDQHHSTDYNSLWPDQLDEKAYWFRNHFVGKPYVTLIGPLLGDEDDLAIISIVKEENKRQKQYRIIVRTKQDMNMGFVVNESDANDLLLQLESLNQLYLLDMEQESTKRSRPLRSISSAIITGMTNQNYHQHHHSHYQSTKWMRASLLFLFHDIKLSSFKELSAETTILSGLEKEFLRYDEIGIPKYYKFGVLTVRDGQTTEEEWFSNSELSTGLEKFMNIMGRPVKLKNYKGYAAGLDTKTGESGEISFVSSWRDHEIMYHVAPLMPSRQHDVQQIHRKRYIGNDIVCIVFVEGENQKFDPSSIRSQFLHVFIIVHWQLVLDQNIWRIEVLHDKHIKPFSPPLPNPPIFYNQKDLRDYLLLKLINAEHASLKSDKFMLPNNKARLSILKSLIETGLEANQMTRSFAGGRLAEKSKHQNGGCGGERPKSAGASTIRSFKSANHAMVEDTCATMPPIPSISRSSVLRDLKSLTRRRSGSTKLVYSHHHNNDNAIVPPQQPRSSNLHNRNSQEVHSYKEDKIKGPSNNIAEPSTIETSSIVSTTGSGIRYKAQNLMSSMIGRKNSRTGVLHRTTASS